MMNFKKEYNLKIISILLTVVFLWQSILYANPDAFQRKALRVPLGDYERVEETFLSEKDQQLLNRVSSNQAKTGIKRDKIADKDNSLYGTILGMSIVTPILVGSLTGSIVSALAMYLVLPFLINLYSVIATEITALFIKKDYTKPERLNEEDLPFITVQIPIKNENFDILKITIDSALALEYPKSKIEFQIIDNSTKIDTRDYVKTKEYAEKNNIVFIHRDGAEGWKARNLNIGMQSARGEYFLILDTDSTVPSAALLDSIPEFFQEKKLGFVQFKLKTTNPDYNDITKVVNFNQTLDTEQQVVRHKYGFTTFLGHNGIWSKKALEKIGGWEETTSEDLATSINGRLAGYDGKFLLYISSGEYAPENIHEFYKQRRKWAFGTTLLLFKKTKSIILSKNLSFGEKFDLMLRLTTFISIAAIVPFTFFLLLSFNNPVLPFIVWGSQLPSIISISRYFLLKNDEEIDKISNARSTLKIIKLATDIAPLAVIPMLEGVWSYLIGNNEGFYVTQKGVAELGIKEALKKYKLGILSGFIFLFLFIAILPGYKEVVMFLPAVSFMVNMIVAPFKYAKSGLHKKHETVNDAIEQKEAVNESFTESRLKLREKINMKFNQALYLLREKIKGLRFKKEIIEVSN
ncbi:MAG: glycosyltransferase family 2 protein [Candidatus Omnitrophota bacterium]|jgi:cellulose synthase/poly-beta-1,6-N-acetylglucosamine synthase-like glycosyltransferase